MYEAEKEEFADLIRDLCISVNRPFDKDILRVFWEDLKNIPFPAIKRQAMALRASGKKSFNSNDLRPPPEERAALNGPDNHALMDRLNAYMIRHLWGGMSRLQRLYKRSYIWTRDKTAPRVVALRVDPDVEYEGTPDERRYSGHLVRIEDCVDLDRSVSSPHQHAERGEDWNEAQAARELLNRKA